MGEFTEKMLKFKGLLILREGKKKLKNKGIKYLKK
jgi:hypothetical protein